MNFIFQYHKLTYYMYCGWCRGTIVWWHQITPGKKDTFMRNIFKTILEIFNMAILKFLVHALKREVNIFSFGESVFQ